MANGSAPARGRVPSAVGLALVLASGALLVGASLGTQVWDAASMIVGGGRSSIPHASSTLYLALAPGAVVLTAGLAASATGARRGDTLGKIASGAGAATLALLAIVGLELHTLYRDPPPLPPPALEGIEVWRHGDQAPGWTRVAWHVSDGREGELTLHLQLRAGRDGPWEPLGPESLPATPPSWDWNIADRPAGEYEVKAIATLVADPKRVTEVTRVFHLP
jgi:hypothetical protein